MNTAANTLADVLLGRGIRPKRWTPGHTEQVLCPRCRGGSTGEISCTVTIDPDGQGAAWQCKRGSCDFEGGERVHGDRAQRQEPPRERPKPHPVEQTTYQPIWFDNFFDERKIGDRVVKQFGIYAMDDRWFPDPIGKSRAIVFPYRWQGEVVNRKYRPYPAKNPMLQEKNPLPTLFNADRIGERVVFVEGEMDVLALAECGVDHAVSLKDGAPSKVSDNNGKRFEALNTHSEALGKVKKFILAVDMDAPGAALQEELARRLGRHKCDLVTWPEGCKDAGEVLQKLGSEAVLEALNAAVPYPVEGLHRITPAALLALRGRPMPTTMTTGTVATDQILKLPTEGRLIVLTGYPGSGKSVWTRYVMMHTADRHDRKWAVFSPEMQPWEQFAAECAEVRMGKTFWPVGGFEQMTPAEVGTAAAWLQDKVIMLVADNEEEPPTMEWLLDRFRVAILRHGITDILIDPWNEIEHTRPDRTTETDYIGRCLQILKAFMYRHGVNIWIVAHPAKPMGLKAGEDKPAPGPYDISGSAHWNNKPDLGLTIHSPKPGQAELHIWKSRFRRFGTRGGQAAMDFDVVLGRYTSTPDDEPPIVAPYRGGPRDD